MKKLLTILIAAVFAGTTFTAVAQSPATPAPAAPGAAKGHVKVADAPKADGTTPKATKKKSKKKAKPKAEKM